MSWKLSDLRLGELFLRPPVRPTREVKLMAAELIEFRDREKKSTIEFGQALPYGGDDGNTIEVRKSFGSDSDRPLDEGYALARRVCGPWEVISEVQRYE